MQQIGLRNCEWLPSDNLMEGGRRVGLAAIISNGSRNQYAMQIELSTAPGIRRGRRRIVCERSGGNVGA